MNGLDRHITGDYGENMFEYEEDPDVEPIGSDDEDAITTTDFIDFYLYGKLTFSLEPGEDMMAGINRELNKMRFWPDVYFISDHGDWHRLVYS